MTKHNILPMIAILGLLCGKAMFPCAAYAQSAAPVWNNPDAPAVSAAPAAPAQIVVTQQPAPQIIYQQAAPTVVYAAPPTYYYPGYYYPAPYAYGPSVAVGLSFGCCRRHW